LEDTHHVSKFSDVNLTQLFHDWLNSRCGILERNLSSGNEFVWENCRRSKHWLCL